jgi:hypothetical protein
METTRWTNPTQPQPLQSSVILLYIGAVTAVIFSKIYDVYGIAVLVAALRVAAGFGVANERKWGYQLAVGMAVLPFLLLVMLAGLDGIFDNLARLVLVFAMDIVLLVLLLHPEARSYQRIWFR